MLKGLLIFGMFDRFQKRKMKSIVDYNRLLWEYQESEAEILIQIAMLNYQDEDFKGALESLEKSYQIYKENEKNGEAADILSLKGDIYSNINAKEKALKYYYQSSELYSTVDSDLQDEVDEKIKEIEYELEGEKFTPVEEEKEEETTETTETPSEELEYVYDQAFEKLDEIINLVEELKIYSSNIQGKQSMKSLSEAYNIARDLGDKRNQGILLLIMGDQLLEKRKTKKSLDLFNQALDLFVEIKDPEGEAIAHLFIGVVSFLINDVENIKTNLKSSIEIFRSLEDPRAESLTRELLEIISEV